MDIHTPIEVQRAPFVPQSARFEDRVCVYCGQRTSRPCSGADELDDCDLYRT